MELCLHLKKEMCWLFLQVLRIKTLHRKAILNVLVHIPAEVSTISIPASRKNVPAPMKILKQFLSPQKIRCSVIKENCKRIGDKKLENRNWAIEKIEIEKRRIKESIKPQHTISFSDFSENL